MSSRWRSTWLKPFSSKRRGQHQRERRKARRHFVEALETRALLDGSCLVDVLDGDLVIQCDTADNGIKVTQEAPGSYRVTGLDRGAGGTSVNGSGPNGSYLATGVDNDFEIDMTQSGADLLQVVGPLDVPADLAVALSNGDVLINGSSGLVKVDSEVAITGGTGSTDDVGILNEVEFAEDVLITAGANVLIKSNGTSSGAVFQGEVAIDAGSNVEIKSFQDSTDAVFEGEVAIDAGDGVYIESKDASIGPVFEGEVAIDAVGEVGIYSFTDSTGAVFEEEVAIDAGTGSVSINSNDTSTGPVFQGEVATVAGSSVYIYSNGGSRGPAFEGNVAIDADGSNGVHIYSNDGSRGPAFEGKVAIDADGSNGVHIFSNGGSTGPAFENRVAIGASGGVYITSYGTSRGPVFSKAVKISAGAESTSRAMASVWGRLLPLM